MFQIANDHTSDVSITIDFDPDSLPKNGLELFLKVNQLLFVIFPTCLFESFFSGIASQ